MFLDMVHRVHFRDSKAVPKHKGYKNFSWPSFFLLPTLIPPKLSFTASYSRMDIAGGSPSYHRILFICSLVAWGGFQYGFDNSAISGLQAMPGFLAVFGYPAPELPLGWNISVLPLILHI